MVDEAFNHSQSSACVLRRGQRPDTDPNRHMEHSRLHPLHPLQPLPTSTTDNDNAQLPAVTGASAHLISSRIHRADAATTPPLVLRAAPDEPDRPDKADEPTLARWDAAEGSHAARRTRLAAVLGVAVPGVDKFPPCSPLLVARAAILIPGPPLGASSIPGPFPCLASMDAANPPIPSRDGTVAP